MIFESKVLIEIQILLATYEIKEYDYILMPSANLNQFKLMGLTLM